MDFLDIEQLKSYLLQFEDKTYCQFQAKLIPVHYEMLGVRTPKLRETAKLCLVGNYKEVLKFSVAYHEVEVL